MRVVEKIVGRLPYVCAVCWAGMTCLFLTLWWSIFFFSEKGFAPQGYGRLFGALMRLAGFLLFAVYFYRRGRAYTRDGEVRAAVVRNRLHIAATVLAALFWGFYGGGNFILYEPLWEFMFKGIWSDGYSVRECFLKLMSVPAHCAAFLTGIYFILLAILRICKWRQRKASR